MALGSIEAWYRWIELENPSMRAREVAGPFISAIADAPWRAPSVPIEELSARPDMEVRFAALVVEGEADVQIWYRHHYATDRVALIEISNR